MHAVARVCTHQHLLVEYGSVRSRVVGLGATGAIPRAGRDGRGFPPFLKNTCILLINMLQKVGAQISVREHGLFHS